jgi:uncharacterized protein YndB with AHSA1/START domain
MSMKEPGIHDADGWIAYWTSIHRSDLFWGEFNSLALRRLEGDALADGVRNETLTVDDKPPHRGRGQLPGRTILAWEPPRRFVLAWKPNLTDNPPTELEVTFTANGDGTRVDLEHRGWERLGAMAEEARSGYGENWNGVLALFVSAAEQG